MKTRIPSTRNISRREAIAATGTLVAGLCAAPVVQAMEPLVRTSTSPLKLSLAAYSMRKYLPNTRNNPDATGEMDILEFIDYGATLGIDAVELTSYFFPNPLDTDTINEIKKRAHVHGLDLSGGAIGNNFTHEPGSAAGREHMKYTRAWIDRYALMGVPVIRVFGGVPAKGLSEERAVENIITNLKLACDYAAEKGVILAIENHDFMTDIDRMLPIVKAIDSPWFGVNLDSGNIAPTADPYAQLARIAPYALNAQIKVAIPVNGKHEPADLGRIIRILKDANYSGYIVLEYEGSEEPKEAIPRYLAELRALI